MDHIYPNIYLEAQGRLACLKLDISELDPEIVDGLKSTADPAIGLAGGYTASTGDLCALAISTRKRILILSFQDTTAAEEALLLADSILLDPSIKKYAFDAPRLVVSLPATMTSLRSREVYDVLPKGKSKPHSISAVNAVLGSSIINEEGVIEVFSSDVCDFDDLKHTFNLALRAWAACHVANRKGSNSNLRILLPFDTVPLTDEVCFFALYQTY